MTVEVREARPEDHGALAAVTLAAYAGVPGFPLGEAYAAALRDVAGRATSSVVLVAVEEGAVLGGVAYVPDAASPLAESLREGEAGVRMLAVDPRAQGRGVGSALMDACLARARAAGCSRVVLHTTAWMEAAHRLYARLGFRRAPDRDLCPGDDVTCLGFVLDLPR